MRYNLITLGAYELFLKLIPVIGLIIHSALARAMMTIVNFIIVT